MEKLKWLFFGVLLGGLIVLATISRSNPTCAENIRLKNTDYQRWVKAGAWDCRVYSTIFDK